MAERRALDADALIAALAANDTDDVAVDVRSSVTSTNDLVARPEGAWALLTADEQVSGRGRAGRHWSSPWAAGIAMSLWVPLEAITVPVTAMPLVAGIAVCDALARTGARPTLKWPNDVLLDEMKVGGILVQLHAHGAVVGIGVNTDLTTEELPTAHATSLRLAGHSVAREDCIAAIVAAMRQRIAAPTWLDGYLEVSATVGRDVRVELVGGGELVGRCTAVADDGSLAVDTRDGQVSVTVGDVHHLRFHF